MSLEIRIEVKNIFLLCSFLCCLNIAPGARFRKESKKQKQKQTHENRAGSERTLYLTVHKTFSVIISQEIPRQGSQGQSRESVMVSYSPVFWEWSVIHRKTVDVVGTFRIFSQSLGGLKGDIEMGGNYLDLLFLLTLFPAHMKNSSHGYNCITFLAINNRHLYQLIAFSRKWSKVFYLSSKIP